MVSPRQSGGSEATMEPMAAAVTPTATPAHTGSYQPQPQP